MWGGGEGHTDLYSNEGFFVGEWSLTCGVMKLFVGECSQTCGVLKAFCVGEWPLTCVKKAFHGGLVTDLW